MTKYRTYENGIVVHKDIPPTSSVETARSDNSEVLPAVPYDQYEREMLEVIDERDYWQNKATELASDIGNALGFEVGEHTSANCPVQSAIDGLFEMRSQIDEWKGS